MARSDHFADGDGEGDPGAASGLVLGGARTLMEFDDAAGDRHP